MILNYEVWPMMWPMNQTYELDLWCLTYDLDLWWRTYDVTYDVSHRFQIIGQHHRSNHRSEIIGQNHRSYTQANLWWLDLWFRPMIVDLWWDLWYQPMISNLWCGPMIDDFDDLPPAAIVAMKFVAGSKLRFLLSTWSSEWNATSNFNLQRRLETSTCNCMWSFDFEIQLQIWI